MVPVRHETPAVLLGREQAAGTEEARLVGHGALEEALAIRLVGNLLGDRPAQGREVGARDARARFTARSA
jgi:hypothetical protein